VQRPERIDDDDLRRRGLDRLLHAREEGPDAALDQLGADVLEEHGLADLLLVEERKALEVAHHLGERLGERGKVKDRPTLARVLEHDLLGEDALAGAGLAHHDVDGVCRKAATEDFVGLRVAGADALLTGHGFRCS